MFALFSRGLAAKIEGDHQQVLAARIDCITVNDSI